MDDADDGLRPDGSGGVGAAGGFAERVYAVVRRIPRGCVATYGQVAELAGSPRASRAVGAALHRNPLPGLIPCHRVVFHDGSLAPGFAFGGPARQRELLEAEGVGFLGGPRPAVEMEAAAGRAGLKTADTAADASEAADMEIAGDVRVREGEATPARRSGNRPGRQPMASCGAQGMPRVDLSRFQWSA